MTTQERWELGRRIRAARMTSGLSIRTAAERAGFSDTTWRRLETGLATVGAGVVIPYGPSDPVVVRAAFTVGLDPGPLLELLGRGWDGELPEVNDDLVVDQLRVLLREALAKVETIAARGR